MRPVLGEPRTRTVGLGGRARWKDGRNASEVSHRTHTTRILKICNTELQNSEWCPEPDLNRHACIKREILSLLCLPISPPGQRPREYHVQTVFGVIPFLLTGGKVPMSRGEDKQQW